MLLLKCARILCLGIAALERALSDHSLACQLYRLRKLLCLLLWLYWIFRKVGCNNEHIHLVLLKLSLVIKSPFVFWFLVCNACFARQLLVDNGNLLLLRHLDFCHTLLFHQVQLWESLWLRIFDYFCLESFQQSWFSSCLTSELASFLTQWLSSAR